ncbi:hypothetical protein Zmor_015907 [Zophobas morio]|uniref:Uncharacterized protein n=1 Tax=Zophobas morio TaxID=2755281 RepID=A0AA38IMW1_9CUCU|nr:hypothetical protein Zmor_015907 [Zophobas morio]
MYRCQRNRYSRMSPTKDIDNGPCHSQDQTSAIVTVYTENTVSTNKLVLFFSVRYRDANKRDVLIRAIRACRQCANAITRYMEVGGLSRRCRFRTASDHVGRVCAYGEWQRWRADGERRRGCGGFGGREKFGN